MSFVKDNFLVSDKSATLKVGAQCLSMTRKGYASVLDLIAEVIHNIQCVI